MLPKSKKNSAKSQKLHFVFVVHQSNCLQAREHGIPYKAFYYRITRISKYIKPYLYELPVLRYGSLKLIMKIDILLKE